MISFVVIAADGNVLPILAAIESHAQFGIAGVWIDDGELRGTIQERFPQISIASSWATVHQQCSESPLIVCGTSPLIQDAVEEFARGSSQPLFVSANTDSHPATLFKLLPLSENLGERFQLLFASGVETASRGAVARTGVPHRVEFTRAVFPQAADGRLTFAQLDRILFADLNWIIDLAGEPLEVTTLLTGARDRDDESAEEILVTLTGAKCPDVKWILKSTTESPAWELALTSGSTEAVLVCQNNSSPVLHSHGESAPTAIGDPRATDISEALSAVLLADRPTTLPGWTHLFRVGEIGTAVRSSIARRRTIPVHFEDASERHEFKSHMSVLGCGTLLWTVFGMILLLTCAAILDPRDREYRTSAAADFVLETTEFVDGEPALNDAGARHLKAIQDEWSETSPVLIIESRAEQLDAARRKQVVQGLQMGGIRAAETRCVARPLNGKWFEHVMWIGWGLVFFPLALFLLAQLLILAARPAA